MGIRYLQTIHPISSNRYNNFFLYLSGQTSFFSIEHQQGIIFFPHIGVHYNSIKTLDFDLFYGYNIPFINQKNYNNNPHQLTLKIGVKAVTNSLRVR